MPRSIFVNGVMQTKVQVDGRMTFSAPTGSLRLRAVERLRAEPREGGVNLIDGGGAVSAVECVVPRPL